MLKGSRFKKVFFFLMALVLGCLAAAGILTSLQPSEAEFRVTYMEIPATAKVDETFYVTAYVANEGGREDTYTAKLTVDGVQVEGGEAEIKVPGGESKPVQFALTFHEAGSYQIAVDGISRTVVVTAAEEPTPEATPEE